MKKMVVVPQRTGRGRLALLVLLVLAVVLVVRDPVDAGSIARGVLDALAQAADGLLGFLRRLAGGAE